MKRLLLTGAGGFVGHHTLAHLLKTTEWDFVVTDSFRHRGTSSRLRSVFDECPDAADRVQVITHDLTTPFDAVTVAEMGPLDYVINMASESHVDRSITDPEPFIRNNVDLMLNVLALARQVRPEKFLQVSTDEVYGPAHGSYRHAEWDTVLPSNPYAASKAAQEAIAISYWRTYGVPLVLTNTMNIIGERQDPEKFVPMIMRNLLDGLDVPIHAARTLTGWEAGSRFYLHARNQADALRFILSNVPAPAYSDTVSEPQRLHVVGEREIRNDEMAELISTMITDAGRQVTGRIAYTSFHVTRPGHDLRYALDGTKLAALGWTPPLPLEQALRNTVEWTLAHDLWLGRAQQAA